jgi:predicted HD phosphohydrolase
MYILFEHIESNYSGLHVDDHYLSGIEAQSFSRSSSRIVQVCALQFGPFDPESGFFKKVPFHEAYSPIIQNGWQV